MSNKTGRALTRHGARSQTAEKTAMAALTILFAAAVYLFWTLGHPCAMSYQEQFQLFLFDSGYLLDRLAVPGGAAQYIGEALVQTFNNIYVGGAVVAAIYVIIQQLTWILIRRNVRRAALYPLSFLPPVMIWGLMGDPFVTYTFPVAILLTLIIIIPLPKAAAARWIYLLIGIPLFYWAVGPAVLILALYALLEALLRRCASPAAGAGALIWALFVIVLSARIVPYPLERLLRGVDYYMFPKITSYVMIAVEITVAVLPAAVIPVRRLTGIIITLVIVILGAAAVTLSFNKKTYELMEYDYLVRINDWQAVIAKAEKHSPDLPMSVCATNLALGMTNQLDDRLFSFYQHGTDGLVPKFEKNFTSLQISAEVYYRLGLINTAQRFSFESMECLPNYKKSCRVVKRLAETAIINGQYEVARKYLLILKKTLCYARWADRRLKMLYDENAINEDPQYKALRESRLADDFMFSETEMDKICGQLFFKNNENKMAMQYLLAYPLLEKNVEKAMMYIDVVNKYVKYYPLACQEAIMFYYAQKEHKNAPRGTVSAYVAERYDAFGRAYNNGGIRSVSSYRDTFWYYLVSNQ